MDREEATMATPIWEMRFAIPIRAREPVQQKYHNKKADQR
jgi:hypothetical protein